MLPNSITLDRAGSWKSNPGDSRMNITTATTTGPQSAPIGILISLAVLLLQFLSLSLADICLAKLANDEAE